jgi:uncharacterized membrane protein
MSEVISRLLVTGVSISAVILAVGLAMLMATGRTGYQENLAPHLLIIREGPVVYPHSISEVLSGLADLRPFAVIQFGVLLLIATPVSRVAASVLLFGKEKDYPYVGITLTVLALLLASLFVVA